MFDFLFGKKEENFSDILNETYSKLIEKYSVDNIKKDRKKYLKDLVAQNGYLPYPYFKALDELTPAETLFALQEKWIQNGVYQGGKFVFSNNKISVLARNNVKNSDWIKKEGHNIKLINLAGLGNRKNEAGKFIDWLKQLLILPTGNLSNQIFDTTIYLIPFHPREFGCAYLPKSSEVSEALLDKEIQELTGLDAKGQVKLFIQMAQLAGHPVIYDILPQTGRFSKAVLANPHIARWFDISLLQEELNKKVEEVSHIMSDVFDEEDLDVIKNIYKQSGEAGDLSEYYQNIYNTFDSKMSEYKKDFSEKMLEKNSQIRIQKKVREVVAKIENVKADKKLTEANISKQLEIIQELIKEGLWPAPGGAWCSAGVPIYDKMSDCGGYPMFRHFDYKGEDVSCFANLDCQTPYYFAFLESGNFNEPVIEYFIDYMKDLQADYNFDGFRVDHIDHVVDPVSECKGTPISYRAPRLVLGKLNRAMKAKIPYFATLAEYMLWDNFYKEYHEDMNFDILWGNDIISQFEKNPEKITEDNQYLTNYNVKFKKGNYLSILKTYNNQDGEFRCIDQYPGQLGEEGALFKWFKYKFLPGGKFAQRPVMYVDGDESFTQRGIEHAIGEEVSMPREENFAFYEKFNAIDSFVKNQPIITDGEAQIIDQDDDGFVAWLITKEPLKTAFLVVANYKYPMEKVSKTDDNGSSYQEWVEGSPVYDKVVHLPVDYTLVGEFVLKVNKFSKTICENCGHDLELKELPNGHFRVFELKRA
ncbi:MAG: hypothetical protein E7Z93_00300 [Cyanobacteria bacterium SIG32]|nr:hypothetical protein [Cyanobacteria bacterium SIG32]